MSECERCGGEGYIPVPEWPTSKYRCPACGGEGKARECDTKSVDAAKAFIDDVGCAAPTVEAVCKLRTLLEKVRAEGVAQGRAAFVEEFERNWKAAADNPDGGRIVAVERPMSRRDEFAKAAMHAMIVKSNPRDICPRCGGADSLSKYALKLADAVLAALDAQEYLLEEDEE